MPPRTAQPHGQARPWYKQTKKHKQKKNILKRQCPSEAQHSQTPVMFLFFLDQ